MAHQSLRKSFLEHQQSTQYWMIVEWYPEFRINGEIYGLISSDDLPAMIHLKNLYTGKQVEVFSGETTKKGSVVIASGEYFTFVLIFCVDRIVLVMFGFRAILLSAFVAETVIGNVQNVRRLEITLLCDRLL